MPDSRTIQTGMRLDPMHRRVLDAWQMYLTVRRRKPVSRTEVIEQLLLKVAPPTGDSPEVLELQEAVAELREARG